MLTLLSLDISSSMKMALASLCSEQSRAKSITAFLMMEHESSFLGQEMMMVARNRAVDGFGFYLHVRQKGTSSSIVGTSRRLKSNIKHNQAMHRMPKPLLRAGFATGDGGRYAQKE